MKKVIIILILSVSFQSNAQKISTPDSINVFYDSLIHHLRNGYLYKDRVDWSTLETIKKRALKAPSFGESLKHCSDLFDAIDGSHLNLFSDYGWYKWSKGREYKQEEFNINFLLKYQEKPSFDVQVIDGNFGYILMPAMLMVDLSQDSIDLETQRMYDEIIKVASNNSINGWIIDLRFNSGGNVFPMLTALYHLLGDRNLYNCIDIAGELRTKVSLTNGKIIDSEDQKIKAAINPVAEPNLDIPVAMITGIMTASAGELIPISFSGRENVITIGEPTAGLTTANSLTQLPFDTKLTLTSTYMTDRNLTYHSVITPNIIVEKEANFEDLSKDKNIIEAINFIESRDRL